MINTVALLGRLTSTPELKSTASGVKVTTFTLAVDRKPKDGEKQTDFIDCVAWSGTAEFITRFFAKGNMIAVSGSIQTHNYEDKDGNKRKATEIIVNNVSFCEGKADV